MHSEPGTAVESPRRAVEEASLLDAYRKGEINALRLVESWIRTAVACSMRELLRERSDVVQEVHLRILTNLDRGSFRGDSSFKSYVWGVTRYTSLALMRDRRKHVTPLAQQPEELATSQQSPEQRFFAAEQLATLNSAVRRLSEQERRLFQLLYCQGLDYQSVGRELGIPVGTVKSRASRFRSALTRRVASRMRLAPTAPPGWGANGTTPGAHRRGCSEA